MENHNKFLEKILNDINSNYSEIKDIFKIHNGINSNVYKISFFKKTDSVLKIYSNSKKVNSLINEKKFRFNYFFDFFFIIDIRNFCKNILSTKFS